MIINLFCDASINNYKRIACAGCMANMQTDIGNTPMYYQCLIQHDATNNSAEILAIWIGVTEAIKLRDEYPNAVFRLFSDSKISLYGLRDWMKTWIRDMKEDGTLISSSGNPVQNQETFKYIYNTVVDNNLRIEFYHQRGHVNEGKGVDMSTARAYFIRANKLTPEHLGLDIEYLSARNSDIDNRTRSSLNQYVSTGQTADDTSLFGIFPMTPIVRKEQLNQYIHCIDKLSVKNKSRHDFRNGYSQ